MARQPSKPKRGKPFRIHVEIPGDLVLSVDKKAKEMEEMSPGIAVTRSEAVRRALWEWVK